jgi:Domain of unknown function (DUF4262)
MIDNIKRKTANELIKKHIVEHGRHIYIVQSPPLPRYAYTIGLRDQIGFDLILPGAIIYLKDEVTAILNGMADRVFSGYKPGTDAYTLGTLGSFVLNRVHSSWIPKLLLGAIGYYGAEEITVFQIVPDKNHRTIDVPDMKLPLNERSAAAWQWLCKTWDLPVPSESIAATEAARWDANEWEISAGPASDVPESEMRVVPLGTMLAHDPTMSPVAQLPVGEGIYRDAESDWHPWV